MYIFTGCGSSDSTSDSPGASSGQDKYFLSPLNNAEADEMFNKDSLRQMGRKPTFNRSYSESSAHFSRRAFQEKIRENVNVSMTSSEKEPLMMVEEETNQEGYG